jgi:hypothetical protein
MSNHIGVSDENLVRVLLWAATTYANDPDRSSRINEYVIQNVGIPPDIRSDTEQPEIWRDYQQVLSELGLIVSTRRRSSELVTPIGLAFLDGHVSYEEMIRAQLLRYQYPNGHHTLVSPSRVAKMRDAGFSGPLLEVQAACGILLRPGVLCLQVLFELERLAHQPKLSVTDLESVLMRVRRTEEWREAVNELLAGESTPSNDSNRRRKAQNWMKLLVFSGLVDDAGADEVTLSAWSMDNRSVLQALMQHYELPETYWIANSQHPASWYRFFGNIDLAIEPLAVVTPTAAQVDDDTEATDLRPIHLSHYTQQDEEPTELTDRPETITSHYESAIAEKQSRLHRRMCNEISAFAKSKNIEVLQDDDSIDLLLSKNGASLLIECKSVTAKNYRRRLRYGLGQVLEYRHRLALEGSPPSEAMLALTSEVLPNHWSVRMLRESSNVGTVAYLQGDLAFHPATHVARKLLDLEG